MFGLLKRTVVQAPRRRYNSIRCRIKRKKTKKQLITGGTVLIWSHRKCWSIDCSICGSRQIVFKREQIQEGTKKSGLLKVKVHVGTATTHIRHSNNEEHSTRLMVERIEFPCRQGHQKLSEDNDDSRVSKK